MPNTNRIAAELQKIMTFVEDIRLGPGEKRRLNAMLDRAWDAVKDEEGPIWDEPAHPETSGEREMRRHVINYFHQFMIHPPDEAGRKLVEGYYKELEEAKRTPGPCLRQISARIAREMHARLKQVEIYLRQHKTAAGTKHISIPADEMRPPKPAKRSK